MSILSRSLVEAETTWLGEPRIREHTGSVIGGRAQPRRAAQDRVYIVVSQVWGHCILMLRASLGKVVHTVKRAGTYEQKSHHKNYKKSLYMSGLWGEHTLRVVHLQAGIHQSDVVYVNSCPLIGRSINFCARRSHSSSSTPPRRNPPIRACKCQFSSYN